MGRPKAYSQTTGGPTYPFTYTYNLVGSLTSVQTPTRTINYSYDTRGRVQAVNNGPIANNDVFASNIAYAAHGAVNSLQLGNGLWETTLFTVQLQMQNRYLGSNPGASDQWSLTNNYGSTNNNGNVLAQTIVVGGVTATQAFAYDGANRLTTVEEKQVSGTFTPACPDSGRVWCEQYRYDALGNRTVTESSMVLGSWNVSSFSTASNRILDAGWAYDNTGNITADSSAEKIGYDAENRQVAFCPPGWSGACVSSPRTSQTVYQYDGDGHRVRRIDINGAQTTFVYAADGALAMEYTTAAPGLAPSRQYLTDDHLGTTRVVTGATGVQPEFHDYKPFGDEIQGSAGGWRTSLPQYCCLGDVRLKFTAKERDSETGLDWFSERYFSSPQGRFTSPDLPFVDQDPAEPQSWNLYSYARNNPLRFIDPTGRYVCASTMTTSQCDSFEKSRVAAQTAADNLKDQYGAKSKQYQEAQRAIDSYGARGVDNGVTIAVGNIAKGVAEVNAGSNIGPKTADNPTGQNIVVTFDPGSFGRNAGSSAFGINIAHEGTHLADAEAWIKSGLTVDPTSFQTESRAFKVSAYIAEGLGSQGLKFGDSLVWQRGFTDSQLQNAVTKFVIGSYGAPSQTQLIFYRHRVDRPK